jgi:DNA-binding response OmpR family regulator
MFPVEKSVLMVDDQPKQTHALRQGLSQRGCQVSEALDLKTARDYLSKQRFDLIILDREIFADNGLENGLDLCKEIRADGVSSRVVFYTNLVSPIDHREGWDAGADDYIEKTWPIDTALARCDAHLARSLFQTSGGVKRIVHSHIPCERHLIIDESALIVARLDVFDLIRKGGIAKHTFDREHRELYKKYKMTDLDLAVFFYLYTRPDDWVTEEQLLLKVWAYSELRVKNMMEDPDSNSGLVHTTIARMRRKIDSRVELNSGAGEDGGTRRPWAYLETSSVGGQTLVSYRFKSANQSIVEHPVASLI